MFDRYTSTQVGRVETEKIDDFSDGGFHVFYVTHFRVRELSLELSDMYESWNMEGIPSVL